MRRAQIDRLDAGPKGVTIAFRNDQFPNLAGLVAFIQKDAARMKLRSDHRLVYMREWPSAKERMAGARSTVARLAEIAEKKAAAA